MNGIYKKFYRTFYNKTNFIPSTPLNKTLFPGDFFHIINGEMIVLGNIFSSNIVDVKNVVFEHDIKLNANSWQYSDGVLKPFTGRDMSKSTMVRQFEYSKQIFTFIAIGSFIFKSNNPEAVKIKNWVEIQNELIIKLTQTNFSFRELYLITETASASDWTLAISGAKGGELEIAVEMEDYNLIDNFGNSTSKTIQTKDIEYYHRQSKRNPSFFKAKKLVQQSDSLHLFLDKLIDQRSSLNLWEKDFYKYKLDSNHEHDIVYLNNSHISILDLLTGNQLNPNTALLYFKWADTSLDDIEKLF